MGHRRVFWLKLLALLLVTAPGAGCTRKFFRQRADADVDQLLTEKNVFEPWRIEDWHVYPDPRARFADPSDPDHPPKPPDDPAAEYLSPNPQRPGKAGVGRFEGTGYLELLAAWDAMNRANQPPPLRPIDSAKPMSARSAASETGIKLAQYVLPLDACPAPGTDRPYLINLEQCCELGLINSRDYQDQRENLYLTALPVSLQRYSFAAQLFATANAAFQSSGDQTISPGQRWTGSAATGFTKLFPSGATLLAQLANQFVFDLTNGTPTVSISQFTLNLAQPLLRGGGQAVTLEPLTQTERNLLYQIRNYARFRKQFYVNVAAGTGAGAAGSLAGFGFTDPSLLAALTTGTSRSVGYLPTVRQAANLEVDRENVRNLQGFLRLFEAYAEGGTVSQLQVDQIKQNLLQGQSSVLSDEQQLRNSLDGFKIQLGMPPTVPLELDSAPIRPIIEQLARFQKVIDEYRATVERIEQKYGAAEEALQLRGRLKTILFEGDLTRGTSFRERINAAWGSWERLNNDDLAKRVATEREQRRNLLGERAKLESRGEAIPADLLNRIAALESDIRLGAFEQVLREYEKQPWKQIANPASAKSRQQSLYGVVNNSFELLLIEARNQRFDLIQHAWPELPRACVEGVDLVNVPLEVAYTKGAQTALTNRLDLMNERAAVVDSWRDIRVRANSLMGVLNVGYSLNSSTPALPAQPLNFSSSRSTQQLTFNGELPLVRRLERNNYRTALINYQRERRQLQLTEDNILNAVRTDIRQLRVQAENYKIQQQQVVLAYNQVENALENFSAPDQPTPGTGPPGNTGGAAGAAALTQQLITAQASLNRAQTQVFSVWIAYLTARMQLFFDLELLPLDARGVWIDEHATRECDANCLPSDGHAPEPAGGEPLPAPRSPEPESIQWRARTVAPRAQR